MSSVWQEALGEKRASHRPTSKRGLTWSASFNRTLFSFTLGPAGAGDGVVVGIPVQALLRLLHQPALASPGPTVLGVPNLLCSNMQTCLKVFWTSGVSNPVVAVGPTPAETKTSLCCDRLCNVVPLASRRRPAICVHPNCCAVADACWKNANSQQRPSRGWVEERGEGLD